MKPNGNVAVAKEFFISQTFYSTLQTSFPKIRVYLHLDSTFIPVARAGINPCSFIAGVGT